MVECNHTITDNLMTGFTKMMAIKQTRTVVQLKRKNRFRQKRKQSDMEDDSPHSPCPGFTSFNSIALAGSRIIWPMMS